MLEIIIQGIRVTVGEDTDEESDNPCYAATVFLPIGLNFVVRADTEEAAIELAKEEVEFYRNFYKEAE